MKNKIEILEILLRYIDNTKEANDVLNELINIFDTREFSYLTDDIIAQGALDHLKEIGNVDRKDVIYHDFTAGARWYRDEQKRRQ